MFVSWCASNAGILGRLVPMYEGCEAGSNWYRSKGRYRTRTSGYVHYQEMLYFSIGIEATIIQE